MAKSVRPEANREPFHRIPENNRPAGGYAVSTPVDGATGDSELLPGAFASFVKPHSLTADPAVPHKQAGKSHKIGRIDGICETVSRRR